jgi:glycosyltransferase involved in cell wall biosynthesis
MSTNHHAIIWLADTPTPYNNFLFSKLQDQFGKQFHVYFASHGIADAPWQSFQYKEGMVSFYNKILGIDWHLIWYIIRNKHLFVIFSGWNDATKRLLILMLCLLGRRYVIWTDTPKNGKFKHKIRNIIIQPFVRKAIAIMGTGKLAVRVLQDMGVPNKKIVNFPYWVKLPDITHSANKRAEQQFRFTCIGRLVHYKGFDLAIRAFAALENNDNVRLDIIGTGHEEIPLKKLVSELGINEKVRFLGFLEPKEIQSYLHNECHCLIHPARHLEPYGVVIVETMGFGIPVIGSDLCGAVVDRIEHKQNGFILRSPFSITELANYMSELINNPQFYDSIGKAARHTSELWPVERGIDIINNFVNGIVMKHI